MRGQKRILCYEGRLAEVRLTNEFIDEEFEEITEREEDTVKEKLKTKWARLEALAGTESRLKRIAQDIVDHFNNREVEGKAMIVCMSRRIAVKMYELLKQNPDAPETAVVITKPEDFGLPRSTKQDREDFKARFKDPGDPLKFVIVRDMWLTGFDAPVLHTMYVDKFQIATDISKTLKKDFSQLNYENLQKIEGVGSAKACQIVAGFELARRHLIKDETKITSSTDVLPLVSDIINKKQEYFVCISLNGASEVVGNRVITVGLVNHSLVHPREVFADVITDRATSVILVHNHPSGTLEPSKQDILMTRQLVEAGAILGIKVLDHLIVSKKGHLSMKETGVL